MTASDPLIKFPCRCGHRFALPADQAASTIQCPRCGLLNDVPTLSDLESLADDGTLILKPPATQPDPRHTAQAKRFFPRHRRDELGEEIDLRNTPQDLADVGAPLDSDLIPLSDQDARPNKPKYDPETGELIRPISLAPRPDLEDPGDIPVAQRALTYAAGDTRRAVSLRRVFVELCMPTNMVVMLFVLFLHALLQLAAVATLAGLFFIAPAAILLLVLILAHYGNTIDETGPEERDELPRLLRGMSFSDDIWNPFCHIAGTLMLCYGPAWVVRTYLQLPGDISAIVAVVLAVIGTIFFPAVLLTLRTSGALNNMRPDRVWGVISAARGQYGVAVIAWIVTAALYALGAASSLAFADRMFSGNKTPLGHPALVYPLLVITISTAHFFAWHLGLIYRAHHADFPWVLQRYISTRARDDMAQGAAIQAQRRKRRYVDPKPPTA